jgi:hypothetical protein
MRISEMRRRCRWRVAASVGELAGAALDWATGHRLVRERALHVAEKHAHTSRGSRGQFRHPRWPAPKGGGAGLAGVRAPALRCVPETRNDGDMMLTTQGWFDDVHERERNGGDDDQRR